MAASASLPALKAVVQSFVLGHDGGVLFGLLFERLLLLLAHPAFLFRGGSSSSDGRLGGLLLFGALLQIERYIDWIAQLGPHPGRLVAFLIVDEDTYGVGSWKGQTVVDVMALLVGLGALVGALHVLTFDKNHSAFERLAVRTLDIALNRRNLRPRGAGEEHETETA